MITNRQKAAYLGTQPSGVAKYRIGSKQAIEAPGFLPEIKGAEDLQILLKNERLLESNNPVLAPGSKWEGIRAAPQLLPVAPMLRDFLGRHPFLLYDPPEIFRLQRPNELVSFALNGSVAKRKAFNKLLRDGEKQAALNMLPAFFRPFAEKQFDRIIQLAQRPHAEAEDDQEDETKPAAKIHEAWTDSRADRGFYEYYASLVQAAMKVPDTYVVTPVPPLLQSSEEQTIKRVVGANRAMAAICEAASDVAPSEVSNPSDQTVMPYFHVYADTAVVKPTSNVTTKLTDRLHSEFATGGRYAGIALTLSGYETAFRANLGPRVVNFVNDVANIAAESGLPLILPRSGWYGAYLTDVGAHAFSSLLNGSPIYPAKSPKGGPGPEAQYGKVPIIDFAVELPIEQLGPFLKEHGEFPHVPGLPRKPPGWNPSAAKVLEAYGPAAAFRAKFGKVWRLMHVEEARRLRQARKGGTATPAKRYFERSQHADLKNA